MISPACTLARMGGGAYRYLWPMMSGIPVAHQRGEAIANLMDFLRTLGMVVLVGPRASVQHGTKQVMTLSLYTCYADDGEARQLQHPAYSQHQEIAACPLRPLSPL